MYKLQVVLVPPSPGTGAFPLPMNPPTTENSQVLPSGGGANGSAILGGGRPDLVSTTSANNLFMSSFVSSHIPQPKLRKLLHFTKPTNTLFTLAQEIVERCDKLYPNLAQPVEVLTLQDSNECDLDPDYLVKDVFTVDNVVRAVLRNDIEIAEEDPQSLYSVKRRRLNSSAPSSGGQSNVLHIAKKRPHMLRNSAAMRVSTPLANQIYPPAGGRQVNSDYEDEDVGDRSVLPPPQPQSQPIRISSGVDSAKKINFNEDTVSRSEAVDPDKSRQQRLPSGTPMRSINNKNAMTPERSNAQGQSAAAELTSKVSATPLATNNRITSGMLRIPEPKISEVENELRQGPASPSAELPARPDRIPMKKQQLPQSDDDEQSDLSAEEEPVLAELNNQHFEPGLKNSASRQTSIADNNGSPIKDGNKIGNVNLAELPQVGRRATRKSSLESKVESLIKSATNLSEEAREDMQRRKEDSNNARRKDTFSDEDEAEEGPLQDDPNDTVRVNHLDSANTSFQKSELLSMLKGNKFNIPSDFNKRSLRSNRGFVDNVVQKPDANPKDVINQRVQRGAARKASELLSSGQSRAQEPSSESDDESSGIETDRSDSGKITVLENEALKKLNIHPLKERVIGEERKEQSKPEKEILERTSVISSVEPQPDREELPGPGVSRGVKRSAAKTPKSSQPATNEPAKAANGKGIKGKSLANKTQKPEPPSAVSSSSSQDSSPASGQTETSSEHPNTIQKSPSREEVSSKLMKAISPAPGDLETKAYQSPEFIEDSDENELTSEKASASEASIPSKDQQKKLPPSILKRKEEAEKRRKEREAVRKARDEEKAKIKAEKEAKKREKEEAIAHKKAEREAKRKLREEEAAKKKTERESRSGAKGSRGASKQTTKPVKESKPADENITSAKAADSGTNEKPVTSNPPEIGSSKSQNHVDDKNTGSLKPQDLAQYFATSDKNKTTAAQKNTPTSSQVAETTDENDTKLEKLKSQFASGKPQSAESKGKAPMEPSTHSQISHETSTSSELPDEDSSSNDNESSGDDSSEDESTLNTKTRRGIVDTPKGAIISIPKRGQKDEFSGVESAPQSTQTALDNKSPEKTPAKVPVTRMMEMSSPAAASKSPSSPKVTKKPESKPSRSLSSLSDLVSRGVPEVKEVSMKSATPLRSSTGKEASSDDQSEDDSEQSDSDDSESSDGSSDGEGSNFISAKSASKALGRNKKSHSGFASLVKDSKKN
ncbi:Nucleolar protein NET1 [Lachancea thermotolerans]